MKTRVVFSPFDLRVNNLLISRYSGKTEKGTWFFYEPEEEKTIVSQTEEPKILNLYYTDLEGNRTQKGKIGQQIYLVIKGKNLKGEESDLVLTDEEIDFEYDGERLTDDILKEYIFENDEEEQIPLKVIEPKK